MATEIERKFLIKGDFRPHIIKSTFITQGYLSRHPERTVRVRIKGEKAFITIKGKSSENGLSRYEWEKEISIHDAQELLALCEPHIIAKTRHIIPFSSFLFEVDEFSGMNEGLILAEIELPTEETTFEMPDWLGLEVTNNPQYYNSYLSKTPYSRWENK